MLDKALLQDLVHDVRGKAQEILDMTADAVQEESAAEPQAVAPSNGKECEALAAIDVAAEALHTLGGRYSKPLVKARATLAARLEAAEQMAASIESMASGERGWADKCHAALKSYRSTK